MARYNHKMVTAKLEDNSHNHILLLLSLLLLLLLLNIRIIHDTYTQNFSRFRVGQLLQIFKY